MSGQKQPFPLGLRISVGQAIDLHGKRHFLKGRIKDETRAMVFEDLDGMTIRLDDADFLALQQERRLRLITEAQLRAEADKAQGKPRPTVTLDSLFDEKSVAAVSHLRRCQAYITAWETAGKPSRSLEQMGAIVKATSNAIGDEKPPKPRTVLAWLSKYLLQGSDLAALVPQIENAGNRTDRLSAKARQIVGDTVDEFYLTDQRLTAVTVYGHVKAAFADYNKLVPAGDRLSSPSENAVRKHIAGIDKFIVDYCRIGKRYTEHKYRQVGSGPETNQHNERWEIDHTTADVLIIDDETRCVIGRPTFTVILDRFTRMVMGYHISFDGPCTDSVLECLGMAISPKEALLKKHPRILGTWPGFGLPRTLVPDNAAEFRSAAFIEICLRLGTDVQYTPVLKAWYKGTIERFIKTLTTDVFHRMPGTTFANFYERNKEKPPEKTAVATLTELDGHILHYIVDVYNVRFHRGLGNAPLNAWKASVAAHGILPPPDPLSLASTLASVEFRKPRRDGIEFLGNLYRGPALAMLLTRSKPPSIVKIKVDRSNMSHIWFIDPTDNEPKELVVPNAKQEKLLETVTLKKHQLARALQRNNMEKLGGNEGLVKAYVMLDRLMAEKTGVNGKEQRRKAAAYRNSLLKAKAREEPAAFDLEISSRSIGDALFDDVAAVLDVPATMASVPDGATTPAKPRKSRKAKAGDAPTTTDTAPDTGPEKAAAAFDPEEYVRRNNLTVKKDM